MMSMMGAHEPGVHIVPQYIHIGWIWQVQMGIYLWLSQSRLSQREHPHCTERTICHELLSNSKSGANVTPICE